MQTTLTSGTRVYMGVRARLLADDHEEAAEWAAKYVNPNPALSWVLGRYVEADRPNRNKHVFPLDDLRTMLPTIEHAPLNINHRKRNVVGHFVAAELTYPTEAVAAGEALNPYIDALSTMWKTFDEEYALIQRAHEEGSLFYSMEAIPQQVSTMGGSDDSQLYDYVGPTSPTYPDELNKRLVDGIVLHKPHFIAGALVIPPERPGWSNADIREVSNLIESQIDAAEDLYEDFKAGAPHLDPATWEAMMLHVMARAAAERDDS